MAASNASQFRNRCNNMYLDKSSSSWSHESGRNFSLCINSAYGSVTPFRLNDGKLRDCTARVDLKPRFPQPDPYFLQALGKHLIWMIWDRGVQLSIITVLMSFIPMLRITLMDDSSMYMYNRSRVSIKSSGILQSRKLGLDVSPPYHY